MIADIEAGNVNCVIVKDLSRFGRDYIDSGKYLERYFPEHEIRFISITDNIDSLKQTYDMLLPIKNIFNEQYARDISQKIHASISTKQKAGEFIGAFASYGYKKCPADKNKLVIDTYAADIIRKIFTLYINGYGKNRIAGILNEKGIVCPSEYKRLNGDNYCNSNRLSGTSYWTYSTIHRILQNEIYIGNMVQGRKSQKMRGRQKTKEKEEWIVVKNTHEAIIDKTTWDKAQDLLKRRTRSLDLSSNPGIFAGFLKCGDCGRALTKKSRAVQKGSNSDNQNTAADIYYYCGSYVRSGRQYCTPHAIPYRILEKTVLEDLQTLLQNAEDLSMYIEQYQTTSASPKQTMEREKNQITTELNKVRKLKKAVYEDYRNELISKEEFIAYRQDYLKKEEILLKHIENMRNMENIKSIENIESRKDLQKPEAIPGSSSNPWLQHLTEQKSIDKLDRNIVIAMIHEITVYENHKIKITYNFSNEQK